MHHRKKCWSTTKAELVCALAHEKVSRLLFTMLVNSIKFIARLNEFQMNDDGVKSLWVLSSSLLQPAKKKEEILQVFYNYCNSIFYGRLLIYEIDWFAYKSHTYKLGTHFTLQLMRKLFTWYVHIKKKKKRMMKIDWC